jgi:hypothetical protein
LNIRFVTVDGSPVPGFAPVRAIRPEELRNQPVFAAPALMQLRAEDAPSSGVTIQPAGEGRRVARSLPWARYAVTVSGVPRSHYIKEFRYNHLPVPDGRITLVPGGELEIVLSDRPASISGSVKGAADVAVILRRWPDTHPLLEGNEPFSYIAPLEPGGMFEFRGLAPGEYRIRVGTLPLLESNPPEGEKIVLREGESKTVELKVP